MGITDLSIGSDYFLFFFPSFFLLNYKNTAGTAVFSFYGVVNRPPGGQMPFQPQTGQ
jgi:hypothetical protein